MRASRAAFVGGLAAGLGALVAPACLGADEPGLVTLRVASAPDDDVTPVLYAEKTGMFRDVGLDVQAAALSNGTAVAAAVIGGAIDLGKASLLSVISAHVRGVPFAIVAASGQADVNGDYSGLLVLKDSPYHRARDLNGQTVSVPALHDIQSLATQELIDKRGGDSKTISFIEEPVTAVAATLDTNRVAAGVVTNPNLARAMATGKYRSLGKPIEEGFNGVMISAWLSTADWAAKNASVVQRFGQGRDQGVGVRDDAPRRDGRRDRGVFGNRPGDRRHHDASGLRDPAQPGAGAAADRCRRALRRDSEALPRDRAVQPGGLRLQALAPEIR